MAGSAWTNQVQNQVIIAGPNGRLLVYSGNAPAAGTLTESIAATSGTDGFGNNYLAGDTVYLNSSGLALNLSGDALTIYTGTNPGASFTARTALTATLFPDGGGTYGFTLASILAISGASGGFSKILNDAHSILDYVAFGGDANTYTVGQNIQDGSATTINSTVAIPIIGLSTNVAARAYYVRCVLRCVAAASGTTQVMAPQLSGTATPSGTPWRIFTNFVNESANVTVNPGNISGFNADPGVLPGVITNGQVFDWTLEGIVQFSAAGTFLVQARQVTSAADETFTVQAGSFLILMPV